MRRANEERAALLREQVTSGQSVAEFCRERGIDSKRMYIWRKREDRAASQLVKPAERVDKFHRVQTGTVVSIELSAGLKLKVPLESLNSVLSELERR